MESRKFASDSFVMAFADALTFWIIGGLTLLTVLFTVVFSLGFWDTWYSKLVVRNGRGICWSHINNSNMHKSLFWVAYGVPEFKEKLSTFTKQRIVRKALLNTMREFNVGGNLDVFAMFVLTVRGSVVRFNDYVDDFGFRKQHSVTATLLSLAELGELASLNFDSDSLLKLCRAGLSFDEIKASAGMPSEWVVKVFSEAIV